VVIAISSGRESEIGGPGLRRGLSRSLRRRDRPGIFSEGAVQGAVTPSIIQR